MVFVGADGFSFEGLKLKKNGTPAAWHWVGADGFSFEGLKQIICFQHGQPLTVGADGFSFESVLQKYRGAEPRTCRGGIKNGHELVYVNFMLLVFLVFPSQLVIMSFLRPKSGAQRLFLFVSPLFKRSPGPLHPWRGQQRPLPAWARRNGVVF